MSELHESDRNYHEQLKAEVRLRDGINACRVAAGVSDGQPVSVATANLGAALVTSLSTDSGARPRFNSISTLSGLRRYLGLAAGDSTPNIYYVETTGAPGVAPLHASLDGFTISIEDLSKPTDNANSHALLMGDENIAALWQIGEILHGRDTVASGKQLFIERKQNMPCAEIVGDETGDLYLRLFEILGAAEPAQLIEKYQMFGSNVLWAQNPYVSDHGLEADFVRTWQNTVAKNRYGYSVVFQSNPFGEGESLIAFVSADFSGSTPTEPKIAYTETRPFTDRHAGKDRPLPLDPGQRALVYQAIFDQIAPGNLSVKRPYA